jgi:hypothetical protein
MQRDHVAKEEAAASTMSLDSVFIMSTIDAKEKQKVLTIDIPGAFLHAKNKNYIIMRMNDTLADLMERTDPKLYQKYVPIKKIEGVIPMVIEGIVRDDESAVSLQKALRQI